METIELTRNRREPLPGRLLVSTPALHDPHFHHTLVLLLDVGDDGAIGVVLNRPSDVEVADVLSAWSALACPPGVLFQGGPVATDSALAVSRRPLTGPQDAPTSGWRELGPREPLGLVDLDRAPDDEHLDGVRIFAGYAGWGAQQLQQEIEEGAWVVVLGEPQDAFTDDPARLWQEVLRRQPAELSWLATLPSDPVMN